jgi:flagellar motor protein MotB
MYGVGHGRCAGVGYFRSSGDARAASIRHGSGPSTLPLNGAALLVVGHIDASGSDAYNQRLSERRAEAVKHFLVARFKLPEDAVTAVGRGKTQPENTADPFAGENRRAQIVKPDAK